MHALLIFAAILATAFARPDGLLHGSDGHVSVVQNTIGTYKYNVHLTDSAKTEERLADGSVLGEYTVINNGIPLTFKYTSGVDGYRIVEGPVPVAPTDTGVAPLPVSETAEVIAARAAHLDALATAA